MKGRFDSIWRRECAIAKCRITDVDSFIHRHYLNKRPAVVMLSLMMTHNDIPVGCVIYSAPPKEVEKRYGGMVWELARLYILDSIPCNAETWLIGQGVKYIKANHKDVKYLISYADPSVGHHGTIYRAANWKQDGMTDDERKSPRCDYYDERTGKKYGRRGNMPAGAIIGRRPRISKYRFIYKLDRRMADGERTGL